MKPRSAVLRGTIPASADTVIIMGSSLGGPRELDSSLIIQLIEIERRGLHTLLVVGQEEDARGPIGAIARYAYVADPELADRLEPEWGRERLLRGDGVAEADAHRASQMLPTPPCRKVSRRVYNWIRQLAP